jgi:PAS domain S-box-containing protein
MGGESILVVEDKVVTARHIQSTLMGLGYKAEHLATSGEEAIEKALESKPDLILMDIMLGEGMDGVQAAQRVRSHMDVPIVFLSAYSDKSILDRAKMTEPFGYLIKPFRPEELRTTIEVALFKHKMESRLRESEQKYRDLVELMPQFVYEIDATGRFTFVNENGLKLSGYQQQDLADGTSLFDILSSEDSQRAVEDFARALNGTNVVESQYTLMKKDGTAIPIVAHAGPIVKNGSVIGIRGSAIDISQIKAAQRTLQDAAASLERAVEDRTLALKSQVEQLKALNTLGQQTTSSLSLQDVLSSIRDLVETVMNPEMTLIFLTQGDDMIFQDTLLESSEAKLVREQSLRIGECLCGLAASDKIPVYSNDIQKDPRCTMDECKRAGLKSFAALPLKTGDSVVGVLGLASRSERDFSKDSIFLETISSQAALGIHNARLYEQSQRHAKELEDKVGELEQSRLALQKSEAKYARFLEHLPDPVYEADAKGKLVYLNMAAEKLLGLSRHDVIGGDFLTLMAEADRSRAWEIFQGTLSGQTSEVELNLGNGRICHFKNEPKRIDDGDPISGMFGIARDITQIKTSEQEKNRLVTAIEQADEIVMVTDTDGIIQYVNPAFERITGYACHDAIGKKPSILKSGKQDSEFYRDLWSTIRRGEVFRGELINRRSDGSFYEESARITPIKDETGRVVNFVAVKRDVTDERSLRKQLFQAQKMESIGTLAGGIAHDFNNLLQAILGYTELLLSKKGPLDPDRTKLEVIQSAAQDGADLVSRILTLSRRGVYNMNPIELNVLVRRVEKLLRRTLPRMIQIDLLLADDLRIIEADSGQIEQIILNLGVNAQHAMPEGGRLVIETSNAALSEAYARTHIGTKAGQYVILAVSDNGTGMQPDVMDRIFEPFFTTKTDGQGTGLGLAMVHGIISQHGGHIRCYSEPGIGTSFQIYFPVSASELISDLSETREMPAFGSETILLVDDDDRVREMAQEMIEMGGYTVLTAHTGEEALEIYATHRDDISLVILDLIMPGMGGKKCLEELLRIDPNVRVLVASGYSSNALTRDETGSGAKGLVKKPYDAKDILGAIRRVIDSGHL